MRKKSVLLAILTSVFLFSACDLGSGLSDKNDSTDAENGKNKQSEETTSLQSVNMSSTKWLSFNEVSYMDKSNFMSMNLGKYNGITLTLNGSPSLYDISSVTVYTKSKKAHTEGSYTTKQWPRDSSGNCQRSFYIETGFAGGYGFTAYISSINGKVKPTDTYLLDKNNYLWKRIENNDLTTSYSFCGSNSTIQSKLIRLPEEVDKNIPSLYGSNTFQLFGFENVETLIIPENYTRLAYQTYWENVNITDYFYEGNERDLSTNYSLEKTSVKMYREASPNTEVDSNEYTYWHYVDGVPTIW